MSNNLPRLQEISKNMHRVDVGNNVMYFSYETLIAFFFEHELLVSENIYSNTTGKHINQLEPDKKLRLPRKEFEAKYNEWITK